MYYTLLNLNTMKQILIILMMIPFIGNSQCMTLDGKNANCPTLQDSIVIYENAVKIREFFDNNRIYVKTSSRKIINDDDKRQIFNTIKDARISFVKIRNEKLSGDLSNPNKKNNANADINFSDYYHRINQFMFYQRELENQIINKEIPVPIYDCRICPVLVEEYKCMDSTSLYFGDIVNIPLYIPVIIKPVSLLTKSEMQIRKEILKNEYGIDVSFDPKIEELGVSRGLPVYCMNGLGSGSIVGFMKNGRFSKIKKEEYKQYLVRKDEQHLLENDEQFKNWLKIRYGSYCDILK